MPAAFAVHRRQHSRAVAGWHRIDALMIEGEYLPRCIFASTCHVLTEECADSPARLAVHVTKRAGQLCWEQPKVSLPCLLRQGDMYNLPPLSGSLVYNARSDAFPTGVLEC